MTSHYLDIRLRPDPEITTPHLLSALYGRLHLTLVAGQRTDIGVSFPGYGTNPRTLGTILRLHGSAAGLAAFEQPGWLRGMRDHVLIGAITPAPPDAPHRTVQRRQFKTSAERLRRRRMRRKGETVMQAAAAIPDSVERTPELPFVQLRSSSTGQSFCLFIEHGPFFGTPQLGSFNSYGMSQGASIPWF